MHFKKGGLYMIMNYGSFAYILSIVVLIVLVIGIYIILKTKSIKTKKIVFFVLAFVNLIQHLFKGLIYGKKRKQSTTT